jgi:SAM-dependent methyltransferase
MKPETTKDIESLLRIYLASAAVGTALELGLFWNLVDKPLSVEDLSQKFNIPNERCRSWLALLTELNLLGQQDEKYFPSSIADSAILKAYSPETWALLAQETRERYSVINNLHLNITHPNSLWEILGKKPPNYIALMKDSPKRAERFTRMLFELHQPLAEFLAKTLDLTDVKKIMDVGGGSGVVSLALLKQYANLRAVVVDIENVCVVGREIANETQEANRITYYGADFLQDDLPKGFDLILECDVGVFSEGLFQKFWNSMDKGGRLVIVSNTNEQGAWLSHTENKPSLMWFLNNFLSTLEDPQFTQPTFQDIKFLLTNAGFHDVKEQIQQGGIVFILATK